LSCGASTDDRAWSGSQDTYAELHPWEWGGGGNVAQARAESDRRTTFATRRKERRRSTRPPPAPPATTTPLAPVENQSSQAPALPDPALRPLLVIHFMLCSPRDVLATAPCTKSAVLRRDVLARRRLATFLLFRSFSSQEVLAPRTGPRGARHTGGLNLAARLSAPHTRGATTETAWAASTKHLSERGGEGLGGRNLPGRGGPCSRVRAMRLLAW
jgi:hypothetical protein